MKWIVESYKLKYLYQEENVSLCTYILLGGGYCLYPKLVYPTLLRVGFLVLIPIL